MAVGRSRQPFPTTSPQHGMTRGTPPPVVAFGATGIGIWLRGALGPGGVVLDVGASIGGYTAVAADLVAPSGHVYAFEPGPDNLTALRQRFDGNGCVTVIAGAVSDRAGQETFHLDRTDPRRHSLASGNVGRAGEIVTVSVVALDDYLGLVARLDLVKIDAQGAELHILRGARRLLRRFRPPVILELWPFGLRQLGGEPSAVLEELRDLGYETYRLSAKGRLKSQRHIDGFLATATRWSCINVIGLPAPRPAGPGRSWARWISAPAARARARLRRAADTRPRSGTSRPDCSSRPW